MPGCYKIRPSDTFFSLSASVLRTLDLSATACSAAESRRRQSLPLISATAGTATYLPDRCALSLLLVGNSPRILRLLIGLGDLAVAVDHLHQQPAGQEHQQHVHHDLRVERRGVIAGCRAQTITKRAADNVLFSNVLLLSEKLLFFSCLLSKAAGRPILSPSLRLRLLLHVQR